jgi:hypothetical protein
LKRGQEFRKTIEDDEAKNEQTEKEKINYRDHEYFINIIDSLKDNYTIMTYKEHIKYLTLCLCVLQPTLRSDFYTSATFITQLKENITPNNYLFINAKTKKMNYIVNTDKVSKSKFYSMNKEFSTIEIEDNFLKELIKYSVEVYPRKYLLQKDYQENETISQNTFLSWLRKITNIDGLTNDMMRSSYINWFYKNHTSYSLRQQLARQMRHSLDTASKYYAKELDTDSVPDTDEVEKIIAENEVLKDKIEKCDNSKISEKKYIKRRYDVLYQLNVNKTNMKPRQLTIDKYKIQYDKEKKLFY